MTPNQGDNIVPLFAAMAVAEKAGVAQRKRPTNAERGVLPLDALLSAMPMGVLFVGGDRRVIYCNPAFERIWRPVGSKSGPAARESRKSCYLLRRLVSRLAKEGLPLLDPDRLATEGDSLTPVEIKTGDGRLVRCTGQLVQDAGGQLLGWLWLFEDVTREHQTTSRLLFLAEHDDLTGLYNQRRFQEELARMLAAGERHRQRVALLLFDLDGFKDVNDTYGHRAGDELLIRVAGAVSAQVRRNEFLARLGGDEFAILAADVSDQEVQALAERIVRAIAFLRFAFRGDVLRLTASAGVAVFPVHASTADNLVTRADEAMYQAKAAGRDTWRIYGDNVETQCC